MCYITHSNDERVLRAMIAMSLLFCAHTDADVPLHLLPSSENDTVISLDEGEEPSFTFQRRQLRVDWRSLGE